MSPSLQRHACAHAYIYEGGVGCFASRPLVKRRLPSIVVVTGAGYRYWLPILLTASLNLYKRRWKGLGRGTASRHCRGPAWSAPDSRRLGSRL